MLLSWLSVLVILTSVLSWLPAAAQDATSTVESTGEQGSEAQLTSEQDEPSFTTQEDVSDDETSTDEEAPSITSQEVPIEITSVSINCGSTDASLVGSFVVANPQHNVSVELQLLAGGTVLRTDSVALNAGQTTFPFDFTMEPADSTMGSSVVVTAREDEAVATSVTSNTVAISRTAEGGTVCGTVAVSTAIATPTPTPTATSTASPSPTATPSATATATATPTPSPTATTPPSDVLIERVVAVIVAILAEMAQSPPPDDGQAPSPNPTNPPAPTPTEPPAQGSGTFGSVVNTNGSSLRCRTVPVDGATITMLPFGMRVETRGAISNGWVPVLCAGQTGWVSGAYFQIEGSGSPAPNPGGGTRTGMVSGTGGGGLRCRTAPVSGGVIMVLQEGARVETRARRPTAGYPSDAVARTAGRRRRTSCSMPAGAGSSGSTST